MNKIKKIPFKSKSVIFLSFFGVGFAPFAPGTFGTMAILPFLYFAGLSPIYRDGEILITIAVSIIACFIAEKVQKRLNLHDPSWIVMDEVVGMSLAWCFRQSSSITHLLVLFVLFRFFDIVKIPPASYFDKKVTHGAGTILDDIVSGIYAGLVYLFIIYIAPGTF